MVRDRERWACGAAFGLLLACAPVVTTRPPEPQVLALWPSSVREVPAYECDTEACWDARAVAASERGDVDVAAGLRGRAFAHAPSLARLDAWADALLACGATERARAALELARRDVAIGDPAWVPAIDGRLAALPPVVMRRELAPGPLTEALRAAYVAIAEGRLAAAADAFAAADDRDPYHLVHAAGVAWARGEPAQARRLWAQARAAYEARGAKLWSEPIQRVRMNEILWHGDLLVRGEFMSVRGGGDASGSTLRFLTPDGVERRRLVLASAVEEAVFTDDGQGVLIREGRELVEYDAMTGLVVRRLGTGDGEEIDDFVAMGAGDRLRTLVRRGARVLLSDVNGRQLASEATREPHSGQDPVLALGREGQLVAIGEPGLTVRVIDLRSGARHFFTHPGPVHADPEEEPEERDVMALAFTTAGDAVVAVDNFGTISRWTLPNGRLQRRFPGACTRPEALAQREYVDVGDVAERVECGRVDMATISPDGSTVATLGPWENIRVRSATTGKVLATPIDGEDSAASLAFSRTGELAAVLDSGALVRWQPGQAKFVTVEDGDPEANRVLTMGVEGPLLTAVRIDSVVQWNLETGETRRSAPTENESLLAVVDEGRRAWVGSPGEVMLRDLRTGADVLRVPAPKRAITQVGQAPPGHALLAVRDGDGWEHHVVGPSGARVIRLEQQALLLSPDGRRLAVVDSSVPLTVWDAETGTKLYTLARAATEAKFAADSSAIAWLSWELEGPGKGDVRSRRLDGPDPQERSLALSERPLGLAMSADGAEVLVSFSRGLVRWSPGTGHRTEHWNSVGSYLSGIRITGGGATLTLTHDNRVEIVSNDIHMDPLATVLLQPSGGWVAVGRSGAVDGSSDAPEDMIVRVTRGTEVLIFDGRLAWDGARVPGLVPRAIAGEDVQPPGIFQTVPRDAKMRTREVLDGSPVERPGKRSKPSGRGP